MPEVRVFETLAPLREALDARRQGGERIALVPTMGNLHDGHLSLIRKAAEQADYVLVTIFVNPLQFGPGEDFERYPRTFASDLQALGTVPCHGVYLPQASELYPEGMERHTRISVPLLSTLHCGASRPGHFDGVCTVVYMLFRMLQPDLAVFGLKDYQQFRIIRKMVEDLRLDLQLLGVETIREPSGLALSSRNGFLDTEQRQQALALWRSLQRSAEAIRGGRRDYQHLQREALEALSAAGLQPDYFHICNKDSLQAAAASDAHPVILAAASAGSTRLIDNIQV